MQLLRTACRQTSSLLLLITISACSSTPDYRALKDHFQPEYLKEMQPDLSLTPDFVKKTGKKATKKLISWPGFLDRIDPRKDQDGRTILWMKHRYLAVDKIALQDKEAPDGFEVSEKSGGIYQCRVSFQPDPQARTLEPYRLEQKALGCTGTVVGFTPQGVPVVQALMLEEFRIIAVSKFLPMTDSTGAVQIDSSGRPIYKRP